jgi:hypothetical protein
MEHDPCPMPMAHEGHAVPEGMPTAVGARGPAPIRTEPRRRREGCHHRPPTADHRPPITDHRSPTIGHRLATADHRLAGRHEPRPGARGPRLVAGGWLGAAGEAARNNSGSSAAQHNTLQHTSAPAPAPASAPASEWVWARARARAWDGHPRGVRTAFAPAAAASAAASAAHRRIGRTRQGPMMRARSDPRSSYSECSD